MNKQINMAEQYNIQSFYEQKVKHDEQIIMYYEQNIKHREYLIVLDR